MRDVAIVGGGPGGLYAAMLLARAGLDVAVYEEHASSGTPVHCTGVLAVEVFDELALPRTAVLNPLTTARFFSPAGRSISYTPARLEAVAIDRLQFDRHLFEAARRAGASMVLGHRAEDVTIDRDGVTLRFNERRERARLCLLACGANYGLQRRLGLGMPSVYLQSAQLEVPVARGGDVEVHFGRAVAPNGFAWVVPVRRPDGWHARIGLMCERNAAGHFGRFVERMACRWGIDRASVLDPPRRKLLPLAPIARTFGDRVLALGDAAGIVKATTGGGIYYSVVSALMAADVAIDCLHRNTLMSRALSTYERRWRARLGPEIEAQLELRALAHRMDDPDIESLFELARVDGIMPIVRKTARFNHHRALIRALFRHPPFRRLVVDRLLGSGSRLTHALGH